LLNTFAVPSHVRFAVHRLNLTAASSVFQDMFAIGGKIDGSGGGPKAEIQLEETGEDLEIVLPYVRGELATP
jgi:hypothetical protein